jgi:hypothetical protein
VLQDKEAPAGASLFLGAGLRVECGDGHPQGWATGHTLATLKKPTTFVDRRQRAARWQAAHLSLAWA